MTALSSAPSAKTGSGVERDMGCDESMYDAGSFRDPCGRVVVTPQRVLRHLSAEGLKQWDAVERSSVRPPRMGEPLLVGDTRLIPTRRLDSIDPDWPTASPASSPAAILEHERLPWISYPYEWSYGMLLASARLHLELLHDAISQGMILRDSTPFNVQFRGTRPVLIDVLSLGPFQPGQAWDGYRQFCETMLFPLLLSSWKGVNFRTLFRGRIEGIPVGECRRMLGWRDVLRRGMFKHVLVQDWLGHQSAMSPSEPTLAGADLRPVVERNLRGLSRMLDSLRPPRSESHWINYDTVRPHYSADDQVLKDRFVARALSSGHLTSGNRRLVWDLGCNTGRFSRMAAEHADCVVALDSDPACIEQLYQQLVTEKNGTIIPAVVDIADPPGGLGWRNRERKAFFERGRPDTILALAVIHHLVFRHAIPLEDVIDWLTVLSTEVIFEFVGPDDVMVGELMRQRRQVHGGYSLERFEARLSRTHRIISRQSLCEGRRTLVHAIRADTGSLLGQDRFTE